MKFKTHISTKTTRWKILDTSSRKSSSSLSAILIEVKTVIRMRENGKRNAKMQVEVLGPARVTTVSLLCLVFWHIGSPVNRTARQNTFCGGLNEARVAEVGSDRPNGVGLQMMSPAILVFDGRVRVGVTLSTCYT